MEQVWMNERNVCEIMLPTKVTLLKFLFSSTIKVNYVCYDQLTVDFYNYHFGAFSLFNSLWFIYQWSCSLIIFMYILPQSIASFKASWASPFFLYWSPKYSSKSSNVLFLKPGRLWESFCVHLHLSCLGNLLRFFTFPNAGLSTSLRS